MGKYTPLKTFLSTQSNVLVPMTFAEIEKVLNAELPASKRYPAWWSNNEFNNTMTSEWLAAGYRTESVDIAGEKLVFRKVESKMGVSGIEPSQAKKSGDRGGNTKRHSLFGCLKGTLTIMPGVDLTRPADPDWGKVYDNE